MNSRRKIFSFCKFLYFVIVSVHIEVQKNIAGPRRNFKIFASTSHGLGYLLKKEICSHILKLNSSQVKLAENPLFCNSNLPDGEI